MTTMPTAIVSMSSMSTGGALLQICSENGKRVIINNILAKLRTNLFFRTKVHIPLHVRTVRTAEQITHPSVPFVQLTMRSGLQVYGLVGEGK